MRGADARDVAVAFFAERGEDAPRATGPPEAVRVVRREAPRCVDVVRAMSARCSYVRRPAYVTPCPDVATIIAPRVKTIDLYSSLRTVAALPQAG